jgi:hypothetical protein
MFNHAAEQGADIEIIKSAKTETGYGLIDGIQDGLSVLGLVPFAGDVVDGINALIYLARGQHAEAAMSAAAMVPFGGIVSAGLRLSKRVGKLFKLGKTAAGTKELISPATRGFMAGEKRLADLSAEEVSSALKGDQQAANAAKSAAHRVYQEARIRALRREADPPGKLLDFMKKFKEGGGN